MIPVVLITNPKQQTKNFSKINFSQDFSERAQCSREHERTKEPRREKERERESFRRSPRFVASFSLFSS